MGNISVITLSISIFMPVATSNIVTIFYKKRKKNTKSRNVHQKIPELFLEMSYSSKYCPENYDPYLVKAKATFKLVLKFTSNKTEHAVQSYAAC